MNATNAGCMFALRGVKDLPILQDKLISFAKARQFGLCFEPVNNLLLEDIVKIDTHDFVFEVCDCFDHSDASWLLCHEWFEEEATGGALGSMPLLQRLQIIQDAASICVSYAKSVEIYLSEDDPYLPGYTKYRLPCSEIANVLYKEYQNDELLKTVVPEVYIMVED